MNSDRTAKQINKKENEVWKTSEMNEGFCSVISVTGLNAS
jgi:hypothetical protein